MRTTSVLFSFVLAEAWIVPQSRSIVRQAEALLSRSSSSLLGRLCRRIRTKGQRSEGPLACEAKAKVKPNAIKAKREKIIRGTNHVKERAGVAQS